jgi:hypothetical protein
MDREIQVVDIKNRDHWPEVYQFMVDDLTRSIKEAKANYLVALGLFCYTEIVGRHILRFREKKIDLPLSGKGDNDRCFNVFAKDYLGYSEILDKNPKAFDVYRNGLSHEFYIKKHPAGRATGVFLYYGDDEKDREKMRATGIDLDKGIAISTDGINRVFVIEPYLNAFIKGIDTICEEMWNARWHPITGPFS